MSLAELDLNQIPSLSQALADYLKTRKRLKANTKKQYELSIRRCFPDWIYLPINKITKTMIRQRHEELSNVNSNRGKGEANANQAARILRAVFNFAMDFYEDKDGEPILQSNPCRVLTSLQLWNPSKRRQRRVMPDQMARFFNALFYLKDEDARDYLIFLILTGMRRLEPLKLCWKHVDFAKGVAVVPDTKSNRPLIFPLSSTLATLLKLRLNKADFPGENAPVFGVSEHDRTYEQIVSITGIAFSPHDARRTFQSTATELGLHVYEIKRLLGHSLESDGWTAGYFVADIENLRSKVEQIDNKILEYACIESSEFIRKLK